jgi:hypothetical protein
LLSKKNKRNYGIKQASTFNFYIFELQNQPNNKNDENISYSIYDNNGKLIIQKTDISNTKTSINVSDFKPGQYFVRVNNMGTQSQKGFIKN